MVLTIFLLWHGRKQTRQWCKFMDIHMAFIILVANMWGFALKEWKGVTSKTKTTIIIGVITIIFSVALVDMEMQ